MDQNFVGIVPAAEIEAFPDLPNHPPSSHSHRLSTISIGSRERGYTLETLKNGKMLFSDESPRAYYEPKDHSNWMSDPAEDLLSNSVHDMHAWARSEGIQNFDVTMFACSNADMIRFEVRMESLDFNRIRAKHGKTAVNEDWHEKPVTHMVAIRERIDKTAAGVFMFCSKRPRIVFLLNGAYLPFPGSIDQLSDEEIRAVQTTLLNFASLHRRQSGFMATYSMGEWRRSQRAHIKIRFPDPSILEDMRADAIMQADAISRRRGSDRQDWRCRTR